MKAKDRTIEKQLSLKGYLPDVHNRIAIEEGLAWEYREDWGTVQDAIDAVIEEKEDLLVRSPIEAHKT